ncbi:dTDP-4-dehydrorhamnose reductase [Thiomicrorhabdus sp.]|uniref:dTDP-4-dehydrorhamnose reductase n=1 Tax=Thiomicrorhabdus sp. TaxID=2039724 RepID=UPI0029C88162|nr:dTDP-4-dehydrorhamnose reductase [Thiomicrorhabdus sp.]
MNKKILVIGKNGQLGMSFQKLARRYHRCEFIFTDRDEINLLESNSLDSFFKDNSFDIVINCAAYTAVDKAETEVKIADQINHLAVMHLAELCRQKDVVLIHVSTDYVFSGKGFQPYVESDPVAPQCVYGETKLKGEQAIGKIKPKGCIIRTSWVYSEFGNNFVKTMLKLGQDRDELSVIFDQIGSPTYAEDLARTIMTLLQASDRFIGEPEIFHFSNEGVCSWFDFAKAIFELSEIECKVSPIETRDYPTPATRPHYSLMNKAKIKQAFGVEIPYWRDSLMACLNELSH